MVTRSPLKGQRPPELKRTVQALTEVRREWQQVTDGKSLLTVETPVGLLLSDIADKLDLTPKERRVLLGRKLIDEVGTFRKQRIRLNLS